MVAAGYDAHEAPKILGDATRAAGGDEGSKIVDFLRDSPSHGRAGRNAEGPGRETGSPPGERDAGRDRFLAATLPFRASMLRDELRLRRPAATQLLLDRLSATSSASGEIQFFQGKLYRLRAASGDDARAIAAYEKAISMGDAPAETYRSLGLVLMKHARAHERAPRWTAIWSFGLTPRPRDDPRVREATGVTT